MSGEPTTIIYVYEHPFKEEETSGRTRLGEGQPSVSTRWGLRGKRREKNRSIERSHTTNKMKKEKHCRKEQAKVSNMQ